VNQFEQGYLAGIIDGEACLTIAKIRSRHYTRGYYYRPRMTITSSNLGLLEFIQKLIGGTIHNHSWGRLKDGHRKHAYVLNLSPGKLKYLLPKIAQNLIAKREVAELMVEFCGLTRSGVNYAHREQKELDRLDEIFSQVRKITLKGKGRKPLD